MSRTPSHTPEPIAPPVVHPLVWGLQLWSFSALLSLTLAGGVSPALRGAFVGADAWILRVDHAGQLTSQVAAITTTLLLVQLGVMAISAARSPWFGLSAALSGAVPTFLLFFAYKATMPGVFTWISAVATALTLLLCALITGTRHRLHKVTLLSGLAILGVALSHFEAPSKWLPLTVPLGRGLTVVAGAACLALHFSLVHALSRKRLWFPVALGGAAVLLGASANAATRPDVSEVLVVVGRAVTALSPTDIWGEAGPYLFSLAYLSAFSCLFVRQGSLSVVVSSWIALGTVIVTTPLICGWLTLCAFATVLLSWSPKNPQESEQLERKSKPERQFSSA